MASKVPTDITIVVCGNAKIMGGAIRSAVLFEHNAYICSDLDYMSLTYDGVAFTFYKCEDGKIGVSTFPTISEVPVYTGWLSDFEYELDHGNWDKKKREAWKSLISTAKSVLSPNVDCQKYILMEDATKRVDDHILYRIKATRDFGDVKTGDLGGYIDKQTHIDNDGNCWVYDNAVAINSCIRNNAIVRDSAIVLRSSLSEDAVVGGTANVDSAVMCGDALVESSNDYSTMSTMWCVLKHKYPLSLGNIGISATAFKCSSKPKVACSLGCGVCFDNPEDFTKYLNKIRGNATPVISEDCLTNWAKEALSDLQ